MIQLSHLEKKPHMTIMTCELSLFLRLVCTSQAATPQVYSIKDVQQEAWLNLPFFPEITLTRAHVDYEFVKFDQS